MWHDSGQNFVDKINCSEHFVIFWLEYSILEEVLSSLGIEFVTCSTCEPLKSSQISLLELKVIQCMICECMKTVENIKAGIRGERERVLDIIPRIFKKMPKSLFYFLRSNMLFSLEINVCLFRYVLL